MARVAFIVDKDFEESEFRIPYDRLRAAGHDLIVVGKHRHERLLGKNEKEIVQVECAIDEAAADGFDALVIPGGYSPDRLRIHDQIVDFTREMVDAGKPVAAICHAGSLLIEADVVRGKRVTSWPSIRTDLENAGGVWDNQAVVIDGNLITSRCPEDLEPFCDSILLRLENAAVS